MPEGRYDLEFVGTGYNSIYDDEEFWLNNNGGKESYHGVIIQDGVIYNIDGELELTKFD